VLRFETIDDDHRDRLAKLIENLPVRDGESGDEAGMMITEILASQHRA
jgi:hypothetical protein